MGYAISFDASDGYFKISERIAIDCVNWFCACVYKVFHQEYLHKPTPCDIKKLYSAHEERDIDFWSPRYNDIWTDKAYDMMFMVKGHSYKYGYYLCDEIYPDYSTLMKVYLVPQSEKTKLFTKRQESAMKDIERAFGVFKQMWHVVKYATRLWDNDRIK
ncbi:uncharacterized protein LOC111879641 [Lactuca sativa]|uniref:uncharacterized protein LOC111879641 n=1 Tax=Lactuca sativa TaxID=4236 RepID=UPI000CD9B1CB|nr:uncharacterized protein LOC111879641 [Lactuca sativa]